jgi:hypothetical protein
VSKLLTCGSRSLRVEINLANHIRACQNQTASRNYTLRVGITVERVEITLERVEITRIRVKLTLVCVQSTLCVYNHTFRVLILLCV